MTTEKSVHRCIVTLATPRPAPALVTVAHAIVTSMTGNPALPTPTPTLMTVTAQRTKGASTARNDKRSVLVTLLQQLKAYVQATADADADNAAAIIRSAGVGVRKPTVRKPRAFAAKPGAVSGSAVVTAVSAGRRASYEWEYSIDGGKTWVTAPGTLQARTTVAGLAAATTVMFRSRAITKAGAGDWSQPVSLLVQ